MELPAAASPAQVPAPADTVPKSHPLLRPIYIYTMLFSIAFTLTLVPTSALVLDELDDNNSKAGFYIGAMSCGSSLIKLVSNLIGSAISDRIGRKPVLLYSAVGLIASSLVVGIAPALWSAFAAAGIYGLTDISFTIALANVADLTPEAYLSAEYSRLGAWYGAGVILGPILSVLAISLEDELGMEYRLPFFFAAACGVIALVFCYFKITETSYLKHDDLSALATPAQGSDGTVYQSRLKLAGASHDDHKASVTTTTATVDPEQPVDGSSSENVVLRPLSSPRNVSGLAVEEMSDMEKHRHALANSSRCQQTWRPVKSGIALLFQSTYTTCLALTLFLNSVNAAGLVATFFLFADEQYHWGSRTAIALIIFYGILAVLSQALLLPPVLRWIGEGRAALIGSVSQVISTLVIGLVEPASVPFIAIGLGICQFFINPIARGGLSGEVEPWQQGELQGALAALNYVAVAVGPGLMGALFGYSVSEDSFWDNPGLIWLLGAFFGLFIVLFFYLAFFRYHHQRTALVPPTGVVAIDVPEDNGESKSSMEMTTLSSGIASDAPGQSSAPSAGGTPGRGVTLPNSTEPVPEVDPGISQDIKLMTAQDLMRTRSR